MQKGLKRFGSILIISALLLTGCGLQDSLSLGSTGTLNPDILNIVTAGDSSMVELHEEAVGKEFNLKYPDIHINVIGTGPGDSGSREILEKLRDPKKAKTKQLDIDVAVVHQSIMEEIMREGLLEKYVPISGNRKYVISSDSVNSLGINVEDYVIPLYHNQLVLAYNSEQVKDIPYTFEQLEKWIQIHPGRFGYNGISNDISGTAFVTAYLYWKSEDYRQLTEGPYDPKFEEQWPQIMKGLKELPVMYTDGEDSTLDLLNRGKIFMGPVWSDMFLSWKMEGKLNPKINMMVPAPGLPSQTMYVVIPKKAKNKELAIKYVDLLTSPEMQAKFIVEENGWFPGIDPNVVIPKVSKDKKTMLFSNLTVEDLVKKNLSFPIKDYFNTLQIAYDKK